ncbi:MAG: hypothetical protein LH615_07245 [Ferruginibacter sp.]|nr:hypothetical protein [Ferruginibacter sp.]
MNTAKARTAISTLGLVIPFQPSMQDERTIQTWLSNAADAVKIKMKDSYDEVCIKNVLTRLEKLFSKLNYNSHRKSIAVILTPDEEKVTYLNFPVKPVAYLNKYVFLLELAANADRQPDFYFLIVEQSHVKLYEYHHSQLQIVYATKQESGQNEETNSEIVFKQVLQTIERMNANNQKPVFVTGSPKLVELFYNSHCSSNVLFRHLDNQAPFGEERIKEIVQEIISQWKYWRSKFIINRIMIMRNSNILIAHIEVVLEALRRSVDGLLLIDKHLKQQLYKSRRANALFYTTDELMNQVERFLTRGNRIEITETGMLKEFGDIVLLPYKPSPFFHIFSGYQYRKT